MKINNFKVIFKHFNIYNTSTQQQTDKKKWGLHSKPSQPEKLTHLLIHLLSNRRRISF